MTKRALIDRSPWLLASLAAAILFCALRLTRIPELWLVPLPAAATGFLAVYALLQRAGPASRYLAAMMAVAAVRDVVFQVDLAKTVSKYIGETEKALDTIFDAAVAAPASPMATILGCFVSATIRARTRPLPRRRRPSPCCC